LEVQGVISRHTHRTAHPRLLGLAFRQAGGVGRRIGTVRYGLSW